MWIAGRSSYYVNITEMQTLIGTSIVQRVHNFL